MRRLIAVTVACGSLAACDRAASDVERVPVTGPIVVTDAMTVPPPGSVGPNAEVDFVIDGDTIDVLIDGREERVRLIGIDTPETRARDRPIECFGPEATAFVQQLLPVGTPIRIERDVVNRDDFGRLLGYVYRSEDGIFVNYEIMRQGYAQPLSIPPNDAYARLFADAAIAAEADDVGIWANC